MSPRADIQLAICDFIMITSSWLAFLSRRFWFFMVHINRVFHAMCLGDARHPGHDAWGHQAEQGAYDPAAPERGLALLEGQHPLEGARTPHPHREHDPALRQGQGWLVDQHRPLQQRANQKRRNRKCDLNPCMPVAPKNAWFYFGNIFVTKAFIFWKIFDGIFFSQNLMHNTPLFHS